MITVEETAKPSKSRTKVAVAPQESRRPAMTSLPGDEPALIVGGDVLLRVHRDEREKKREQDPKTGSRPHCCSPCCPV